MTPIRILFHVTHLRRGGGIESSLLSWLTVLDRDRYAPGLSIAYPTDELDAEFRPRIPADVPVHVLGQAGWLSHQRNRKVNGDIGWAGRIYEELLLPQVRKRVFASRFGTLAQGYDLVVDYDMSAVRFVGPLGKPMVGIGHFRFPEPGAIRPRRRRALAGYYRRYAAIVAICDAMRIGGEALFPQLAARFTTLYPGFDQADILRRAALPAAIPQRPYIVTVTRLEETQKDIDSLIRAYAILVRRHAVAEDLLIVGQGRHRNRLEALATTLGLRDRIVFHGFDANPLPLVRAARMMVLSSRFEGLPTALIEALMLGQVLVASDCPTGPREILDGGRAGMLVAVGDVDALAHAMLGGLQDADLRKRLQAAALVRAQVFGVPAFRQRLGTLIEGLQLERVKGIGPSS